MIKKYLTLALLALSSTSLGMQQTIEQARMLEQLRKDSRSYVSALPRELIDELEPYRRYVQILHTIGSAHTFDEAINNLKKLASQPNFTLYFNFNDPKLTNIFIYVITDKFNFNCAPAFVAQKLETEGARRWLKEIKPMQDKLLEAARMGDLEKVKELVGQGAYINSKFVEGTTPLMFAAEYGYIDIVQYLIDRGADINAQNKIGATALIEAIKKDHSQIVKLLLEHRADPTIKNMLGFTALSFAEENQNQEIIKLLRGAMTKMQR